MNRLPFGSFHATHFSPQQVQQWQSYLQQMQPLPVDQYYPKEEEMHQYTEEYIEESWPIDQEVEGDDDYDDDGDGDLLPLSKEAIAIFEFSEAYSTQRKQDTTEENDDEKSQQEISSILNVSTTLHYDGIEAPTTSLVLLSSSRPLSAIQPSTSSPHQIIESNSILTKQHLLNSAYLGSCSQHQNEEHVPLMMWPVLPFRL